MSYLLILLWGCKDATPPAAAPTAPVPVVVENLVSTMQVHMLSAVGQVQTLDTVELRSEISGLVDGVYFEDGQRVNKGKLLVQLHAAEQEAGLLDAQARAKLAFLDLERATSLFKRGDLAQAELDRAQANDALAQATVARAEEALRKTRIVAPFDGVLGKRDVSPGQLLDPSRVVGRLDRVDPLVVEAAFGEESAWKIQKDQAVTVRIAGQEPLVGRVSYAAPRLDAGTRTLLVRCQIPNPQGRILPGMTAEVFIATGEPYAAMRVPSEAMSWSGKGAAIWVVGDDQKVSLKPVTVGERGAERVEILSGATAGEKVVVEGLARMRPGAEVKVTAIREAPEAPAGEQLPLGGDGPATGLGTP